MVPHLSFDTLHHVVAQAFLTDPRCRLFNRGGDGAYELGNALNHGPGIEVAPDGQTFPVPPPDLPQGVFPIDAHGELCFRGMSVTCVASASSVSATLAVTGWEFDPDDTALPPVLRASGPTDPTWEGAMVTSGQVRVNGSVDGVPGSASAHVSVTPRDWSTQVLGLDLYDTSPDTLPERPLNEHQLGSTTLSVTLNASTLEPAVETVPDGPNVGYQYFTAIPFRATVAVAINTRALAQGSAFYLLQEPRRRVIADTPYRSRADVLDLYLPGVRAHEGIRGRDDANSHVAIFAGRLEREARDRIEPLVSRESFPGFGALREELNAIAAEDSGAMDAEEDTRNPFKSPCTMHYFN